MSLQDEILLILEQLYRHMPLHDLDADVSTLTPGPEARVAAARIGALLHEGGSLPTHTVEDRRRFRRTWKLLEKTGACDGWGGAESRRAWKEFLAAGCPEDLVTFIYEAANGCWEDEEKAPVPHPKPTEEKMRRVEEIKARIKAKQERNAQATKTYVIDPTGNVQRHSPGTEAEIDAVVRGHIPAGYCALCRAKELEMYGDVLCEAGPKHDAACRAAGCLHPFDYGQA